MWYWQKVCWMYLIFAEVCKSLLLVVRAAICNSYQKLVVSLIIQQNTQTDRGWTQDEDKTKDENHHHYGATEGSPI